MLVHTYARDHSPTHLSNRILTHIVAMATTPSALKRASTKCCIRVDGRRMVNGNGGGRECVYFFDQKDHGRRAFIRDMK